MNNVETRTNPDNMIGESWGIRESEFSDKIAFGDHKIKFVTKYCKDKDVLDIGCVNHNPKDYQNKYWLHKAIKEVSKSVQGMDLYKKGVEFLNEKGFNIVYGDAQNFDLNRKFDVIVAGDLIEHLEDFHGFLSCCKKHMHEDSRLLISTPSPWYWRTVAKAIFLKEIPINPEHTCWICPRNLRQLVARHDMSIGEIAFGSRHLKDRIFPLPPSFRQTFHAEVFLGQSS